MAEDNLSKQVDEIEALSAIYPDEWKTQDEVYRTYKVTIKEGWKKASLVITLPEDYPSSSPPYYLITAPWMKNEDVDDLYSQFEQIYVENAGESIIHLWIEKMREQIRSKIPNEETMTTDVEEETEQPQQEDYLKTKVPVFDVTDTMEVCPSILSSNPFTDKKSTFQGHAATVTNVKQVKLVLAKLYENRKIAQATHNMYSYRIYNEESKMWVQDCEDDGETHAGGRLMHLLQILDVKNVVVVVSRWFGGILLGGDRFKHINNAARDALELGHYVVPNDDTTKKKSKKK